MNYQDTVRISVHGSSAVKRSITWPAVARMGEAGLTVCTADGWQKDSSFESLQTALFEQKTDCILLPGTMLPRVLADGSTLAAVLPRRSARMCLIGLPTTLNPTPGNPIGLLPTATVAVPSVAQRMQILALNPDFTVSDRVIPLDTLGAVLRKGTYHAVLLASDDCNDLDLDGMAVVTLGPEIMLPMPGSGTSVILGRTNDPLCEVLAALNDVRSHQCFSAERALAEALEWPAELSCFATPETDGGIRLQATISREAPDPRSALVRVGTVASTPETAAKLCFFALQECSRQSSSKK